MLLAILFIALLLIVLIGADTWAYAHLPGPGRHRANDCTGHCETDRNLAYMHHLEASYNTLDDLRPTIVHPRVRLYLGEAINAIEAHMYVGEDFVDAFSDIEHEEGCIVHGYKRDKW